MLGRRVRDDRGVTGVEYALIAGLIAIVVAGGAAIVGPAVSDSFLAAGAAVETAQTTEGSQGECAGVFVTAPVTCDPSVGVSVAACTNGVTGDGSAGAPWGCAVPPPPDQCATVFVTDPVTCAAGVPDTSMCTNGVTGDGSAGAPWECAPAPSDLCADVFVDAPVTCAAGVPDTSTCANGVTGDGSAGAPWACAPAAAAPADPCTGVFIDAPVTCAVGVVDTSMCTNGVTGDGSAGAPWACTPAPVAKSPYSGPTPSASYAVNLGSSGSYALPVIAGIQYAKGACTDSERGGCGGGQITVSGTTLSTGSGWDSKAATQTITWTIPETDTTLAASGSFTVRVT